jgi:predicted N-formylglutamate amidohydrolase
MFRAGDSSSAGRVSAPGTPAREEAAWVENAPGHAAAVIICDHASNHVPARLGTLGLTAGELERHIAWDPGALAVARGLSQRLDAPLVASGISRLVVDCNRDPSAVDSIVRISEDTVIPGNDGLSVEERARRLSEAYEPFHRLLGAVVSGRAASHPVALIAVHTFTPVYRGALRPWHVGVLFDRDERLARPLLAALGRDPALVVGANQPYSPRDRVYHTLDRHGQARGLPSVMIEIRNDLVATPPQQDEWGERLAVILASVLETALETEPGSPPA